jgi:hypothetical protein
LENVRVLRYHEADSPLLPRCEVYRGYSLEGGKENIVLRKENYVEILDFFNKNSIFAQIEDEVFCLSPFIHFYQEEYETNAVLCFYKQDKGGKYHFEVVSKSKNKTFEKSDFAEIEKQLRMLVV